MTGFVCWLFSQRSREKPINTEAERLELSMKTTAKSRFTASVRLKHQGQFAFYTTTLLSLGLILIPLMQNSGVPLALKPGVLNAMQIFLAVSVLVYSVVMGTARYDYRSEQLNECGNKVKELIRELRREREAAGGALSNEQLARLHQRYSDIVTDVESHTTNDYRLTVLEMTEEYSVTGLVRMREWCQSQALRMFPFLLPGALLLIETIFITDMLGATTVFTGYLNGARCA